MGAAFNYNVLEHEPGAFAHNRQYATKLVYDSIDFADDGVLNNSVEATINTLQTYNSAGVATGDFPAADKAAAISALSNNHNGTVVGVKAAYVSGNQTCNDCHAATTTNPAIRAEYAESAHGDTKGEAWMHYDWTLASRASCRPCHTTQGYINKLTGSTTTVAGIATLGCNACHSNTETGATRPAAANFAKYTGLGYKYTVQFADYGTSNVCMPCHSGRETGQSIARHKPSTPPRASSTPTTWQQAA